MPRGREEDRELIQRVVLTTRSMKPFEKPRMPGLRLGSCHSRLPHARSRHALGGVRVKAARLRRCSCDVRSTAMRGGPHFSTGLFLARPSTPEPQRLHAETWSLHSFRETARLIRCFLPCHPSHHTTVRDRLGKVATGLEKTRTTSGDSVEAPPEVGLTVFLDS